MSAVGGVVVGVLAATVVFAIVVIIAVRKLMILRYVSRLDFETTVQTLAERAKEAGWTWQPLVVDMKAAVQRGGYPLERKVELVNLCKPTYAGKVLSDSPHIGCLMPCTFSIYEGDDGKVYVAKMNTGLMGRLFGGTVAEVMGGAVTREEAELLESVIKG